MNGDIAASCPAGALANRLEVAGQLVVAQVAQLAAMRARRLEGVVHLREVLAQQLGAGLAAHPQVLERGDVAEIPGERAHQRVVDAVEVLAAHAVDEPQGALARLLEQRLGPSTGQ